MLNYNNRISRVIISLTFGVPSYFMLFLIRGYPIEQITHYAFWQYSGVASATFIALFEIQNYKSRLLEKTIPWELKFNRRLFIELFSSLITTLTLVSLASYLIYVIIWDMELYSSSLMLYFSLVFLISLTFMVFVNAQFIIEKWRSSLTRANELEKENISARLEALQNQLSPHFLFNNLSILNGLIDQEPTKAKHFTSKLSDVFRYILNTKNLETVPLRDEIGFINDYRYVLKCRFGEKINIDIDTSLTSLNAHIPPVSIQQLLENAVKHNETSFNNPLHIKVFSQGNYLIVSNEKKLRKNTNTIGSGLNNLKERYEYLTEQQILIENSTNTFRVGLPLLKIDKA